MVATGGLSIPKIGATAFGYELARQFGIPIEPCRPALVPLTLSGAEHAQFAGLAGISAPVVASAGGRSFREKMLFTHRGLSGPAILQISSYWKPPEPIRIDWAADHQLLAPLRTPNARRDLASLNAALRMHLPARLADRLAEVAACTASPSRPPAPRATRRPKSPPAASAPPHSLRKPWSAAPSPASISSEKWSTSPANSAASTSSGPGLPPPPRAALCDFS
jgi:predicted flavoprotein YhiN